MHPRNIYKIPPDFSKLVVKYPEFSEIATIDLNGTVRINFKDLNSLRVLTKCLLRSDFDLNVDFPIDKLIPTVPLRLNYLLWIEDLLNFSNIKDDVKGLDIGTGASCIYPLLAAKHFKWKMLGTEINEESFKYAMNNVIKNNLQDYITVKQTNVEDNLLINCVNKDFNTLDFCMCNPPFYSSLDEIDNARSLLRATPPNAPSGSSSEIVTSGGETNFVSKLIDESLVLRDSIKIYTTMLGHKSSLKILRKVLHENGITQFIQTTFQQGKTARWGLAWSFNQNIKSFKETQPKNEKKGKPISFIIPQTDSSIYTVPDVTEKVLKIFDILEIKSKIVEKCATISTMEIIAKSNTWSHQRRKRRQNKSCDELTANKNLEIKPSEFNNQEYAECADNNASNKKRKLNDSEKESISIASVNTENSIDQTNINMFLLKESRIIESEQNATCTENDEKTPYLKAALCLRKYENFILLEIAYMAGQCGKDGVNQIIQFIKNNWL